MDAKKIISDIFKLDTQIADLRDQFENLAEEVKSSALTDVYTKALKENNVADSISQTLVRSTDMVCSLDNAALIIGQGLLHLNPDIRHLSGEALMIIGEDSVDDIVPAIDLVLKKGGLGAQEMPFILTYLEDPKITDQIYRFLESSDVDVVSSAIEALAQIGDPDSIAALKDLTKDTRTITMDEEPEQIITLGQLAQEAIDMIDIDEE